MDRPTLKVGSFIRVGKWEAVVRHIWNNPNNNPQIGYCEVVFHGSKPTSHDVDWNGSEWVFSKRNDEGGYVQISDPFYQKLKYWR